MGQADGTSSAREGLLVGVESQGLEQVATIAAALQGREDIVQEEAGFVDNQDRVVEVARPRANVQCLRRQMERVVAIEGLAGLQDGREEVLVGE
eukprot:5708787-Heterocapsa_arctica.AAC.1